MLAFSIENLLFLLLIAVAGLFQLLSKTISKAGRSDSNETSSSPTTQTPRPIPRASQESDADRIRKFLEALGQPPSSTLPSPVLPRADVPPRALAPVKPSPVIIPGALRLPQERRQKPKATKGDSHSPEPRRSFQEIPPPPIPVSVSSAFEIHETLPIEPEQPLSITGPTETYASPKPPGVAKGADFKMDIATLLASKATLREVILLREVLGPPRGLQPLDIAGQASP